MIPKIIWQTYKTKSLPRNSIECVKTWQDKNPGFSYNYYDDEMCESFISENFSQEFVNMYKSLPYGVMKADAWRIAVIYIHGGIYADLDTICIIPAEEWLKDYDLVAAVETPNGTIGNFTFAATPKHPALLCCIEELLNNYNCPNYLNKSERTPTPIQNYGAHAFHAGISKYIQSNNLLNGKIYSFDDNAFTPYPSEKTFVRHLVASLSWKDNYDSWRVEQQRDFNIGY